MALRQRKRRKDLLEYKEYILTGSSEKLARKVAWLQKTSLSHGNQKKEKNRMKEIRKKPTK